MKAFRFDTTNSIISEPGALAQLGDLCVALNVRRPLIVTDPGVVAAGLYDKIRAVMTATGLEFQAYTEVIADPPESVIFAALAQARQFKADGVIGFGGGSSMDTAKLIALLARSGETLADIYGVNKVKGKRMPLIQIPTTAGTGSEVTAVAIVTTGQTTKAGVVSNELMPDLALLDAELTLGLPPAVTANTGVDAMVHAIEAYTSKNRKNPYSDMLAREALRLLGANIHTAVHDGKNLEARQAMLLGACLAGQSFANAPVAAVHALAYPLGGNYHIPHGLSNSLVLPTVLRFNAPIVADAYAELAPLAVPTLSTQGSSQVVSNRLIEAIETLIRDLKMPARLREMNIPEADLPRLADEAMLQQRLLVNNPRPVSREEALAIYQAAY
ncbi:MAG TPA: iron-containing alcohol dehydrogenase [Steroidobacteraceae bacterium]|nr:iron-containing alcohol dehydrogenase [Steroidobacteraceae bacterium]